jgi:predicted DNA-binding ribbon-helix-helix protein
MKSERPTRPRLKSRVGLEDGFRNALKEIAARQGFTMSKLVSMIDRQQHDNLSSAIRIFVLDHYRAQCARRKEPVRIISLVCRA